MGDDAGLAAARPGEDKDRPVDGLDGFFLGGVEFREDVHNRDYNRMGRNGETLNNKLYLNPIYIFYVTERCYNYLKLIA